MTSRAKQFPWISEITAMRMGASLLLLSSVAKDAFSLFGKSAIYYSTWAGHCLFKRGFFRGQSHLTSKNLILVGKRNFSKALLLFTLRVVSSQKLLYHASS